MDEHYNQNYTKDQIEVILNEIKECVLLNRFTISINDKRKENIDFIKEYNIRDNKQKSILLNIKVDDFCHSLKNDHKGYEDEILYVFVPQMELYNADGEAEMIDIYTKFNIIKSPKGNTTIVISFHKRNKPIDYLFR